MKAVNIWVCHFLGLSMRNMIHIKIKPETRNPNVSKKKAYPHKATVIINCLDKFSQPRPSFSSSVDVVLSLIRMTNERTRRRMEARNPPNPGPGALRLPTPSLRLEVLISIETTTRQRLVACFNRFISNSSYGYIDSLRTSFFKSFNVNSLLNDSLPRNGTG
jgi:hypothetical protein